MSDGNREEACEAMADENRAGGNEKKRLSCLVLSHDLKMN